VRIFLILYAAGGFTLIVLIGTKELGALLFGIGFGGILFLIGVACLREIVADFRRVQGSQRWRPAQGTVTRRHINDRSAGEGSGREYQVEVSYGYHVSGERFESLALRLTSGGRKWHGKRTGAEEDAQAYPVGLPVTVFYDPVDPEQAALSLDWSMGDLIGGALVGLLASGSGAAFILQMLLTDLPQE
jgi:predicted lipid-binding transport protein (Tim44 family)